MPARPALSLWQILQTVTAIYADLAERPFSRQCLSRAQCCHFQRTGKTPHLTLAEALVAVHAWRASGRTEIPQPEDGACPFLERTTQRCRIYAARPLGCRTHFCAAAGGNLPRREVLDLIHRLEDLSRDLGDTEARPLLSACRQALDRWRSLGR